MADLSARVTNLIGASPIMPSVSFIGGLVSETLRPVEAVIAARGLGVALAGEFLRLRANTVTAVWNDAGRVAFVASPDHATLTNYEARVRVSGSSTVVATQTLSVPDPDGNGVIVVSLTATYATLAAGEYTVSIAATDLTGTADSAVSNAFTLPIT